jgi:hypothetical protein
MSVLTQEDGVCTVMGMVKTVRVRIQHTVEVDIAEWAAEFGTEPTSFDVRADVKGFFSNPVPCHLEHIARVVNPDAR